MATKQTSRTTKRSGCSNLLPLFKLGPDYVKGTNFSGHQEVVTDLAAGCPNAGVPNPLLLLADWPNPKPVPPVDWPPPNTVAPEEVVTTDCPNIEVPDVGCPKRVPPPEDVVGAPNTEGAS